MRRRRGWESSTTPGSPHRSRTATSRTGSRPAAPPAGLASGFYPARGPYSSADALVLDAQMREIAAAGIGDRDLLLVGARVAGGQPAAPGDRGGAARTGSRSRRTSSRTTAGPSRPRSWTSPTCARLGVTDFYVWASATLPDAEWAELNARLSGVRTFANTNLAGRAAAGGFDGLYTYDVLLFDGALFPRLCGQARRLGLLCAPSVGPGYDARRATGDSRVRPRRNGATYDSMWRGAVKRPRRPGHDHELQRVARGHADRAGARRPARLRVATTARGGCAGATPRRLISIAPPSGCGRLTRG